MGNMFGVLQLDGDMIIFGMNVGGDFLSGGNLFWVVQFRCVGVVFGLCGDLCCFGDDQFGIGVLVVVFVYQWSRDIVWFNVVQMC